MLKEALQKLWGLTAWFLTAITFGIATAWYWVDVEMGAIRELCEASSVAEVNKSLILVNDLRLGKYDDAIEFQEGMIEIHTLTFTNDGSRIPELSENDRCVLDKVKKYWENECDRECFPELAPILEAL